VKIPFHYNHLFTFAHTLQDITIFIFGPSGLKLPRHAPFGEFLWILPDLTTPTLGINCAKHEVVTVPKTQTVRNFSKGSHDPSHTHFKVNFSSADK